MLRPLVTCIALLLVLSSGCAPHQRHLTLGGVQLVEPIEVTYASGPMWYSRYGFELVDAEGSVLRFSIDRLNRGGAPFNSEGSRLYSIHFPTAGEWCPIEACGAEVLTLLEVLRAHSSSHSADHLSGRELEMDRRSQRAVRQVMGFLERECEPSN